MGRDGCARAAVAGLLTELDRPRDTHVGGPKRSDRVPNQILIFKRLQTARFTCAVSPVNMRLEDSRSYHEGIVFNVNYRRAAYQSVTEHPIFSSSAAFHKEGIGVPGSHGHVTQSQTLTCNRRTRLPEV